MAVQKNLWNQILLQLNCPIVHFLVSLLKEIANEVYKRKFKNRSTTFFQVYTESYTSVEITIIESSMSTETA